MPEKNEAATEYAYLVYRRRTPLPEYRFHHEMEADSATIADAKAAIEKQYPNAKIDWRDYAVTENETPTLAACEIDGNDFEIRRVPIVER